MAKVERYLRLSILRKLLARISEPPGTQETGLRRHLRTMYVLQLAYLACLFAIFMALGVGLTPDIIFLVLAVGFAWGSNRRPFLRDFAPFILLLLSYDAMRGFADNLGGRVRVDYPIRWDEALFFGEVPTVTLQRWLFEPGVTHWYDYGAALLHIMHFIVPLFFAAIIWQRYRQHYWPYVITLLLTSYAGFITFMLVPTAPPWYAAEQGRLSGVSLVHENLPFLKAAYHTFSPNPVAAMPSLHAAYPWLFFLFALRIWRWRGALLGLYPAAMFLAIVYLGHHYAVDVIGGVLYAMVAYVLVCSRVPGWPKRVVAAARGIAPNRAGARKADAVGVDEPVCPRVLGEGK